MEDELQLELAYFDGILRIIDEQLIDAARESGSRERELGASANDAYDDIRTAIDKEERTMSIALYLTSLARENLAVESSLNREAQLRAAYNSPYFARVDFLRDGRTRTHYIGRFSIRGESARDIRVFDWRAPVSSLFYRYGVGPASYNAPIGAVEGTVTLKRQFEIKNAKFEYYFDSDVQIVDEYLRKLLSRNASESMKSIVETIQRDQDEVIRDMRNELLMVQGAAGSGKTSIALHRAAYLMYEGLTGKLSAHNIAVLAPNRLFEKYIGGVLPELGEQSVTSLTFASLVDAVHGFALDYQSKFDELEAIITGQADGAESAYKASEAFAARVRDFADSIAPQFRDVEYLGRTLFTVEELETAFNAMDASAPLAVRLMKIEQIILNAVHRLRQPHIRELEREAEKIEEHRYEFAEYARMISIAESTELILHVRTFTRLDYAALYFEMLGETVPATLKYCDAVGVTLLKLSLEPSRPFGDIRQLVVDEAQDYDSVHFAILKRIFPSAHYTVLGDVSQTVVGETDLTLYDRISATLKPRTSQLVTLSRSFRSTKEILDFSAAILGKPIENFGRSGEVPTSTHFADEDAYIGAIAAELDRCLELGYGSIALICDSMSGAKSHLARLKSLTDVRLMTGYDARGAFILPAYMAKGLEFDAVLVCEYSRFSKHLLYVACTRALHRLNLFATEVNDGYDG
ncbi:MAG: AAA family ATPase [Oscillospiraceae bacterium]|nr:AAA family ATPase [Oscillospiraceae bacterium]